MLKIFIFQATWNGIKFYFPFWLLNLEFFATPFMGRSRLGTRLVVVLLFGMRPHAIRDLETIFHVMLTPDQDLATMPSYALYVELNLVHSWAGQFPSWAELCGDMQFLCGHFHKIAIVQDVLRWDLFIGCAVTRSHIIRDDPCLIGKQSTQSPPWSWLWELQPWVPNLSYARKRLPLTYLENKKEH